MRILGTQKLPAGNSGDHDAVEIESDPVGGRLGSAFHSASARSCDPRVRKEVRFAVLCLSRSLAKTK